MERISENGGSEGITRCAVGSEEDVEEALGWRAGGFVSAGEVGGWAGCFYVEVAV